VTIIYELLSFITGRYYLLENTMSTEKLNPVLTKTIENGIAA
jgi:hypothetical protein